MKHFILIAAIAAAALGKPAPAKNIMATCTGSKSCKACKNCKYCGHCAKKGGTCGVCK